MERRMAPRTPRIDPAGDMRGKLIQLAAAYNEGTLGTPSRFFPEPTLPAITATPAGRGPPGPQVADLTWRSEYQPFFKHARDMHLAIVENQTAHARWWTSGRGRPTIVLLHGWGGGNQWMTARAFLVPYWLRHGWDVAAFV